ncbi:MAG: hypothetical protein PHI88_00895 [Candidatus Pacebacteria bacterium]|nr:hypothetical protein [Candidatus Paceibacterota bacterium]
MIFGHQKNLKILSRLISNNRLPHAVLFAGPNKIGKRKVAIEISKYLEGNHKENFFEFSQKDCNCNICQLIENNALSEITEIGNSEGQISIKEIRSIKEKLSLSSIYPYKIVIINNIEKLSPGASGALLKVLEEPKGNTIFFLLTSMPGIVLKTILSRVSIFKFSLLKRNEIRDFLENLNTGNIKGQEEKILDLSLGRPGTLKEMVIDKKKISYYISLLETIENLPKLSIFNKFILAEKIEKENSAADDFLFLMKFWFRDLLILKENYQSIYFNFKKEKIKNDSEKFSKDEIKNFLGEIQKTQKYFMFSNTSKLLALENLFLSI